MADALFSKTQQRVLGLLFGQPERSFYSAELIQLSRGGSGSIQRELGRLVQSGLVAVRTVGRQKHYQAEKASPLFNELRAIAEKTFAVAEPIKSALSPMADEIQAAFVYGSVAKQEDAASSDIDLMIIGDRIDYATCYEALEAVTKRLGRAVNPTIYSAKEFGKRRKEGNAFLRKVLAGPRIWLIGDDRDIGVRESMRTG